MLTLSGFLLLLATPSFCLYSSSDEVVELTAANFKSKVLDSDELWLVEFYAPWCGHCRNLAPAWKTAAEELKGIANVGAVDMDQHQSVGGPYGIRGFPTIKVFGFDKNDPSDYNGQRSSDDIVDFAMKAIRQMVKDRASGKKKSSGGGSRSSGSGGSSGGSNDDSDVVVLTDSNFREKVIDSEETWIVEFYAPWCGHCKNLEPTWNRAATKVKADTEGQVKLGKLDATVHQSSASKYGVRGYPTIKIFRAGFKNEDPIDYNSGRDLSSIVATAMEYYVENIDPPTVDEIVSQEVLEEKCGNGICIIAFLPDIYDGKAVRDGYINLMSTLGENFKKQRWGWGWAPALKQPVLEKMFQVGGSGYPEIVGLNMRKQVYAKNMGAFSEEGLRPFLNVLTYGKSSRNTFALTQESLPQIETVEPWDGQEAPAIEEEDFDLSDFSWDDEEEEDTAGKDEL